MNPQVPVLAHPQVKAWPAEDTNRPGKAKYFTLGEALTLDFPSDAHFQAVSVPATPHRLRKAALDKLQGGVPIVAMVFDIDGPNHGASDAWRTSEQPKIAKLLAAHPGAFVYQTRGGYRVLALPDETTTIRTDEDGKAWRLFYQRCCLYLAREFGIEADLGCADWTRLYRLPHATRERKAGPEQRPTMGDPNAIGPWTHKPGPDCLEADIGTAQALFDAWQAAHPSPEGWNPPPNPYAPIVRALDAIKHPEPSRPAHATPSPSYTGGESARARKALGLECEGLCSAPDGARNPACNVAAVKLGHYIASGELTESAVVGGLFDAMVTNGSVKKYGRDAVMGTIASGLAAGKKDPPRTPPRQGQPKTETTDSGEPATPAKPRKTEFMRTDLGNAERMIAQHGKDLRYCFPWGKWFAWDGKKWRTDDCGAVYRLANKTVRSMYAEAAKIEDNAKRDALTKHARDCESRSRLEAMVALARALPGVPVQPEALDQDAWLLNCENGTIDLRTGILREHRREDLCTKCAPVRYDPNATAPKWTAFLSRIFAGDSDLIGFVQRALGYSFTGRTTEQVFLFMHGDGANGKGVLCRTVAGILGEYAARIPTDMLLAKRGDRHPTELTTLHGRRFTYASEPEQGRGFAESTIKDLTGEDPITAHRMREDFWTFQPTHKLWFAANHQPAIRGTDHGIWRRLKLIPFLVQIPDAEKDPQLFDKLQAEWSGILRWAVEGCTAWQASGLGEPAAVKNATADYRSDQDTVAKFIADCIVRDLGAKTQAKELFDSYLGWCTENGERPKSQRAMGQGLKSKGFQAIKSGATRLWGGVRLTPEGVQFGTHGTHRGRFTDNQPSGSHGESNRKSGDKRPKCPNDETWEYDS